MISERDQRAFLEFARPPAGTRLAYCVGTTFTLDFTVLIQLALATQGEMKTEGELDMPVVFKKLYDFESRSIVFCQSCRIQNIPKELFQAKKTPRQRLLTLLDASIEAVRTSELQGTFHPKVWVMRFDSVDDRNMSLWKLLVTSRNLTEANTWEIGAELIGHRVRTNQSRNRELVAFLGTVTGGSAQKGKARRIVSQAIADLSGVEFRAPGQFKEWEFIAKKGVNSSFPVLDDQIYSKIIAVSPFLSKKALASLEKVQEAILITDVKDVIHLKAHPALQPNTYLFRLGEYSLHAKVYLCRRRDKRGTDVFLGSANLTRAGMFRDGANVEALVRLHSRSDLVSDFERKFVFEKERPRRLHRWLYPLKDDDLERSESILEAEERKKVLEEIRARLSSGTFRIRRTGRGRWAIKWFGTDVQIPKGVYARVWFSDAAEGFNLKQALDGKKSLSFNGTPSALVSIRLSKKGVGEIEFGTVAEIVGGTRRRSEEILHQVAQETEFVDMLKAVLGESAHGVASAALDQEASARSRKRRNSKGTNGIDGYVEALLLADIDNPDQRELIRNTLKSYARISPMEVAAVQEFWEKLVSVLDEGETSGR